MKELRSAAKLDPNDAEVAYRLGMAFKAMKDDAAAVAAFRRALELRPDFERARYNLGITLKAQGRAEEARDELKDIQGLHEFRARLAESKSLIMTGAQMLEKGDMDGALHNSSVRLRRVLRSRPHITTRASHGSEREKSIRRSRPSIALWNSSPIMPKSM